MKYSEKTTGSLRIHISDSQLLAVALPHSRDGLCKPRKRRNPPRERQRELWRRFVLTAVLSCITVPCHGSLSSFLKFPSGYLSAGGSYFKSGVRRMIMGKISKRNQPSPEWGVKANPNKQCWLASGRYCHVCLHHRHQPVHWICLCRPRSQNKSTLSAGFTVPPPQKVPRQTRPAGCTSRDGSVSVGSCCVRIPWRLSFGLKSDWAVNVPVTFSSNTQSSESPDQSKTVVGERDDRWAGYKMAAATGGEWPGSYTEVLR